MTENIRNRIRSKVLGSTKLQRKSIQLFGEEVEVQQPNIGDIINAGTNETDTIIDWMIEYIYVPGTNDKVFEMTDRDALLQLPYGAEAKKFTNAFRELSGEDLAQAVEDQAKN